MKKNKWCEKCIKKGKKIKAKAFIYHKNRIESLCIDCYRTDEKKGGDYLIYEYTGYVDKDAMKKYKVKISKVKDNWIFGTIKGLKFQAQVFEEPSKFGLYHGRISKLLIIRKGCPHWGDTIYHYERGLGDKPTKEGIMLSRQFLKVFPKV